MKANRKLIWFILAILALSLFLGYWFFISRNSATPQETDIKVVEVEEVGIKDIQQTIRLIGTIKPKNSTVLIAKTAGILDSLLPAGQVVKKGTLIAKIDNNEIERSYLLSESVEKLARDQYERALLLHKSGHLSKSIVEEKKRLWIEAQKKMSEAKIEFEKIRFQAPFDGTIGIFKAREGAQVQEGDPIVSFYDPASLMVEFGIPASVMTFIHEGQPVRIQRTSYTLTKVQKMIDEETHMSPAYVDFSCENCVIGAGIDVDLTVQRKEKVIVIPFEAVFLRNGKTFVYCVKENKAGLTPVNLGMREKEDVEITSGLQKGDILIARGQARLHPDIAVKIYHQAPPFSFAGSKMNITTYFIKHPVISLILNGMIILLGFLCFFSLPVREYPDVEFPTLTVQAFYPNASAELVESSVINVLEDRLAGVEGLEAMVSTSKQGSGWIEISFRSGMSMDRALILVRDAVALSRSRLPKEVNDPVIDRKGKSDGSPFMVISLESSSMDFGDLTHYANLNLKNAFRSLKGVASADVWGQPYTYVVTLDPEKMYAFGVNADEIYEAIEKSRVSSPVGKFRNEVPTTLNSELKKIRDYEDLLIKEKNLEDDKNKQYSVFLKSVAHIELKTDDTQFRVRINGNPGLCLAINKASDANPLSVSDLVYQKVEELRQSLPSGIKISIVEDQADFVRASLKNIQSSILEAIILVLGIVFLFLRNIKATLIPLITIPISMIGTLLLLKVFGFSINIMTLLAMVLAVGLVVDDAIVVLENISRHRESGLSSFDAALKGAKEIGFAIIAMTLTLVSVYAPIVFIEGALGQLFTEFAIALAGSVLISGVVALTLSPLMCATILKGNPKHLWPQVDLLFERLIKAYSKSLEHAFHHKKLLLCVAFSSLGLSLLLFKTLPREVAPKEDRGLVGVYVPALPGKDINSLEEKVINIEKMISSTLEAKAVVTFMGDWGGSVMLPLKSLSERKRSASEIVDALRPIMMALPSIDAWPWSWDSGLPGLDNAMSGSELSLVVSTTESYRNLFDQMSKLQDLVENRKLFDSVRHDLRLDLPAYRIDVDTNTLADLNLNQKQMAKMIEIFFSGDKSLTFQKDGILYTVLLQGKTYPWTLDELYLINSRGKRISLGTLGTLVADAQPKDLYHYNQMRSTTLRTDLHPGEKIETAMPKLWEIANNSLPQSYKKEWTGAAKLYQDSALTMAILFSLALIFIYAILSVQFENFIDPLIVMLTVPLAISGALFVVWILGQSLNIYTQVGLITLMGLISKHGILIVEFANQLGKEGLSSFEAVQKAATLRLRPILMTTAAMIFGAIPLVLAHDSGAECRRAIGAVLVGGLAFGTIFTLFILPTVYYALKSFPEKINSSKS